MVEKPHATHGDEPGEYHSGEGSHEHTEKCCECPKYAFACFEELLGGLVQGPNDASYDEEEEDLLPKRPALPRRLHDLSYLADRPRPNHLHKTKNCRDALLEKLDQLVEELHHDGASSL